MKKQVVVPVAVVLILAALGALMYFIVKNGEATALSTPNSEVMKSRMTGGGGSRPPVPPPGAAGTNPMMNRSGGQYPSSRASGPPR